MKNYYKILGVPQNASEAKIKQAYRDRIKQIHPDVNKSMAADALTKELNEAWSVLSDPLSRMSYDIDMNLPVSGLAEYRERNQPAAKPGERAARAKTGPLVFCEKCGRTDATVRVSPAPPVPSFLNFPQKPRTAKNLCTGCRMQEARAVGKITVVLIGLLAMFIMWAIELLFVRSL